MKIYNALLFFCLVFIHALGFAVSTNNSSLYNSANSIIANEPTTATESVAGIYAQYRNLEQRWMGADNAKYNREVIKDNPLFATTNIFNESYNAGSQTVKYYRLNYTTGYKNQSRDVSGLVLIPPTTHPKGVILFFHSTMTGKLRVPSLKFNEYKTTMLSAIFAANGYVVVAPDYIGLGSDYKISHPYILYPEANVDDGYNMLIASKKILQENHIIPENMNLFVSGYSEGASYALWFSRIYQTNNKFSSSLNKEGYKLTKTVPIEGAYDLSNVMFPFLLGNQIGESQNVFDINSVFWGTLLKPSLLANTLLGFAAYNNLPIQSMINPRFYNMKCVNGFPICFDHNNDYNLDSIRYVNTSQLKMALNYYFQALGLSNNLSSSYGLFNNSVKSLINPNLLNNESSLLYKTARNADIVNWHSVNPVTLVSLSKDSLVPEANSQNAYNGMLNNSSQNVRYIKVDNNLLKARAILGPNVADHVTFELYALLIALKEFNSAGYN